MSHDQCAFILRSVFPGTYRLVVGGAAYLLSARLGETDITGHEFEFGGSTAPPLRVVVNGGVFTSPADQNGVFHLNVKPGLYQAFLLEGGELINLIDKPERLGGRGKSLPPLAIFEGRNPDLRIALP